MRNVGTDTAFSALTSGTDPAMAIVTTAVGDERGGCLIGFHVQSSMDPARYSVWLSKANHTYRLALRATHLAVHFVQPADFALAEAFGTRTGDDVDKFADVEFETHETGVPVLSQVPNRLVARRVALLDEGGDHVCISAEVVDAAAADGFTPLRFSQVKHLRPGHENTERHNPPTERAAD
jgi:flavin reductase (DIM6/NTAB) family NADH-FMN oxidoreductase RutF